MKKTHQSQFRRSIVKQKLLIAFLLILLAQFPYVYGKYFIFIKQLFSSQQNIDKYTDFPNEVIGMNDYIRKSTNYKKSAYFFAPTDYKLGVLGYIDNPITTNYDKIPIIGSTIKINATINPSATDIQLYVNQNKVAPEIIDGKSAKYLITEFDSGIKNYNFEFRSQFEFSIEGLSLTINKSSSTYNFQTIPSKNYFSLNTQLNFVPEALSDMTIENLNHEIFAIADPAIAARDLGLIKTSIQKSNYANDFNGSMYIIISNSSKEYESIQALIGTYLTQEKDIGGFLLLKYNK